MFKISHQRLPEDVVISEYGLYYFFVSPPFYMVLVSGSQCILLLRTVGRQHIYVHVGQALVMSFFVKLESLMHSL